MMTRSLLAALALFSLVGCAGNSAYTELPPIGSETIDSTTFTEVPGAMVYEVSAHAHTFLVEAGDDAGQTFVREVGPTDEFDATWKMTEGDWRTQYWTINERGDLMMTAVIEYDDEAISFFEPPLILAPAVLEVSVPFRHSSQMRVMDLATMSNERERGQARRTITFVGSEMMDTPFGHTDVLRFDITFVADLQLANAEKTSTLFIVPGSGTGYEQRREVVRALGALVMRDSAQSIWRQPDA